MDIYWNRCTSSVCSDFAETVHNNAEKAGIKTAWKDAILPGHQDMLLICPVLLIRVLSTLTAPELLILLETRTKY